MYLREDIPPQLTFGRVVASQPQSPGSVRIRTSFCNSLSGAEARTCSYLWYDRRCINGARNFRLDISTERCAISSGSAAAPYRREVSVHKAYELTQSEVLHRRCECCAVRNVHHLNYWMPYREGAVHLHAAPIFHIENGKVRRNASEGESVSL